MNKKASMELGINAIVILIIALALLGLAMAFITNLFKSGQGKLGSLIARTDLPVHADASNQLVFDNADITAKVGTNSNVIVSVYNDKFSQTSPVNLSIADCTNPTGDHPEITLSSLEQKIPLGTDAGYKAILTIPGGDSISTGNYICTVQATDGSAIVSQQLFVNVVT